ncbi:MAG: hypothetical protein PHU85_19225, partial [Phycisphaerae bacterium]|nr:hypothetical protein [Phycisphaerae bacterium]
MHKDLPPTTVRGYRQTNTNNATVSKFCYLGPIIVAQRNRPVRVKFTNNLPTGAGGNLFLPVDATVMGAGMGPLGANYSQNRGSMHLHGGNTPWISDGTPHQWTTPANENSWYPKGVSVQNVPDMPAPGAGSMTFYYTNQQSARLMFYHDHSYGITRLNVYGGVAAGYLLNDPVEQLLVASGAIPADQIPLIVQDKTFVPGPNQLAAQDPTWNWGTTPGTAHPGDLWFPHVYMPNQNPFNIMGMNDMGRWDYGPWFWPPYTGLINGPVANPYYDPVNAPLEPPQIPGTPNPSLVPEAFMDTPIVNGTAYPFTKVGRKAYRLRILNACNDRSLNLQLYIAKSNGTMWDPATGNMVDPNAGEIPMVPAVANQPGTAGYPPDIVDGRDGGVPDVRAAGPSMIQIGTEGGILPAPAVLPNTPVGYEYNRRSITVLNVSNKTLFLGPAERADVIVDFSQLPDGTKVILYNDAPAPVPAFDSRYDYYTGSPDQADAGGSPSTMPGYGPNTRTILQFQVDATLGSSGAFSLATLQQSLPVAYSQSQDAPIIPQAAYNAAFNANYPADAFVRIQDTSCVLAGGWIASVSLTNGGTGYTGTPTVSFTGGGGSGAAATVTLSAGAISRLQLTSTGSGYTSTPTVTITGGGGSGATATVALAPPRLASISLINGGSGYTAAPTVTISGGGGAGATATAALKPTSIASFSRVSRGSGYTSVPTVAISGGGGSGATGTAIVANGRVTGITLNTVGSGYTSPPTVAINGGGGTGAVFTANLTPAPVGGITLTAAGAGFTSAPRVRLSGGGSGAVATATLSPTSLGNLTLTRPGSGYTSVPTVTIAGGGGTGAAAAAFLTPGAITSLTLTSRGSGYATAPTVTISGGGGNGATANAQIGPTLAIPLQPKAIQELFEVQYGRMNALLGTELPNSNFTNQTTIPYGFIDPPTELLADTVPGVPLGSAGDGTQLWKITHNGVDTHAIHFHLFNVQLINRVGWDGVVKPPAPNEV